MPKFTNLGDAAYYGDAKDVEELLLANASVEQYVECTYDGTICDCTFTTLKLNPIKAAIVAGKIDNLTKLLPSYNYDQLWKKESLGMAHKEPSIQFEMRMDAFELARNLGQTNCLYYLIKRAIRFLDSSYINQNNFKEIIKMIVNAVDNQAFNERQIKQIAICLKGSQKDSVFINLIRTGNLDAMRIFLENGADVNTIAINEMLSGSALQILLSLKDRYPIGGFELFAQYNVDPDYKDFYGKATIDYCNNATIKAKFNEIFTNEYRANLARLKAAAAPVVVPPPPPPQVTVPPPTQTEVIDTYSCCFGFFAWSRKKQVAVPVATAVVEPKKGQSMALGMV